MSYHGLNRSAITSSPPEDGTQHEQRHQRQQPQRWPAALPLSPASSTAPSHRHRHRHQQHQHGLFAVSFAHLEGKQIIAGGREAYWYVLLSLGGGRKQHLQPPHTTPFATALASSEGVVGPQPLPAHAAVAECTAPKSAASSSLLGSYRTAAPNPTWYLGDSHRPLFYWDGRSAMADVEFVVCARAASAVAAQRETLRARAAQLADLLEEEEEKGSCSYDRSGSTSSSSSSSSHRESSSSGGVGDHDDHGGVRVGGVTSKCPYPSRESEEVIWPFPKPHKTQRTSRPPTPSAITSSPQHLQSYTAAPSAGNRRRVDSGAGRRRRQRHGDRDVDPVATQPVQPSPTDTVVGYARVRLDATMLDRPSKLLVRPTKGSSKKTTGAALSGGGDGGAAATARTRSPGAAASPSLSAARDRVSGAAPEAPPTYTTVQLGTRGPQDAALLRLYGTLGSLRFSLAATPLPAVRRRPDGTSAAETGEDAGRRTTTATTTTSAEAYLSQQEEALRAVVDRVTAHDTLYRDLYALLCTGQDAGANEDVSPHLTSPLPSPLPSPSVTDVPAAASPSVFAFPQQGCSLVQAAFHPLDPILDLQHVRSYLTAVKEAELSRAMRQLAVLRRVRLLDPTSRAEWWAAKLQRVHRRRVGEKGDVHAAGLSSGTFHAPEQLTGCGDTSRGVAQTSRRSRTLSTSSAAKEHTEEGAEEEGDGSGVPQIPVDALLARRGGCLRRLLWSTHTAVTLLVRTLPPSAAAPAAAAVLSTREWPCTPFVRSLRGADPAQAVLWQLHQQRARTFARLLTRWVATLSGQAGTGVQEGDYIRSSGGAAAVPSRLSSSSSLLTAHTHATASSTKASEEAERGKESGSVTSTSSTSRKKSDGCGVTMPPDGLVCGDAPDALAQTVRATTTTIGKEADVRVCDADTAGGLPRSTVSSHPRTTTAHAGETVTLHALPEAPTGADGFRWDRLAVHLREEDLLSLQVTVRVSLAPPPPVPALLPPAAALAAASASSPTPSPALTAVPIRPLLLQHEKAEGEMMRMTRVGDGAYTPTKQRCASSSRVATGSAAAIPSPSVLPLVEDYSGYPTEDLCVGVFSGAAVVQQLTLHMEEQQQQQQQCHVRPSLSSPSLSPMREANVSDNKAPGDSREGGSRLVPLFVPCYRATTCTTTPAVRTPSLAANDAQGVGCGSVSREDGGRSTDDGLCGWLRVVLRLSPSFSLARLRALHEERSTHPLLQSKAAPAVSRFPSSPRSIRSGEGHAGAPLLCPALHDGVPSLPTRPSARADTAKTYTDTAALCDTVPDAAVVGDDGEPCAPMPLAFVADIPTSTGRLRNATGVQHRDDVAGTVRGHAYYDSTGGGAALADVKAAVESVTWSATAAAVSSPTTTTATAVEKGVEREVVLCSLPTAPAGGLVLRIDQAVSTPAAQTTTTTTTRTTTTDVLRGDGVGLITGRRYLAVLSFPALRDMRGAAAAAMAPEPPPAVVLFQTPSTPAARVADGEVVAAHHRSRKDHVSSHDRARPADAAAAAECSVMAQWVDATYILEACGPYLGLPLRLDVLEVPPHPTTATSKTTVSTAEAPQRQNTTAITQGLEGAARPVAVVDAARRLIGSVALHYSMLPFVGRHRFLLRPPPPTSTTTAAAAADGSFPTLAPLPPSAMQASHHSKEEGGGGGEREGEHRSSAASTGRRRRSSVSTHRMEEPHVTVTVSWSISPELQQHCLLARLRRLPHRWESLLHYAVTEEGVRWVYARVQHCALRSSVTAHLSSTSALLQEGRENQEDEEEEEEDAAAAHVRHDGGYDGGDCTWQSSTPTGNAMTAAPAMDMRTRRISGDIELLPSSSGPVQKGTTAVAARFPPFVAPAVAGAVSAVQTRCSVAPPLSFSPHPPLGHRGGFTGVSPQLPTPLRRREERRIVEGGSTPVERVEVLPPPPPPPPQALAALTTAGAASGGSHGGEMSETGARGLSGTAPSPPPSAFAGRVSPTCGNAPDGQRAAAAAGVAVSSHQQGRRHLPLQAEQAARTHVDGVPAQWRRGVAQRAALPSLRLRLTVLSLQNLRLPGVAPTATAAPSSSFCAASFTPYVVVRYQGDRSDNHSLSLPAVQVGGPLSRGGGGGEGVLVYFTAEFDVAPALRVQPCHDLAVEVRDVLSHHVFGVAHVHVRLPFVAGCAAVGYSGRQTMAYCGGCGDDGDDAAAGGLVEKGCSEFTAGYCGGVDGEDVEEEGRQVGWGGDAAEAARGALGETVTHVVPMYRPVNGVRDTIGLRAPLSASEGESPVYTPPSSSLTAHAVLDAVAPVVGEMTVLTTLMARPSLARVLAQQPVYMHLTVLGARGLAYHRGHFEEAAVHDISSKASRTDPFSHYGVLRGAPDAYVVVSVRRCEYAYGAAGSSDDNKSNSSGGSSSCGGVGAHDSPRHRHNTRGGDAPNDVVWSTRDYRSLTIPHLRSPLWYLELPPLLCSSPADVYTFTVYDADADGFDRCLGECRVTAGALLHNRQGREVPSRGGRVDNTAAVSSDDVTAASQSLQLPLCAFSAVNADTAEVAVMSGGDGGCGCLLLEWSFLSADDSTGARRHAQCGRRTRAVSAVPPFSAAVVVEVQLRTATALALEGVAATWARAGCTTGTSSSSSVSPMVLAAISVAHDGSEEGGGGVVMSEQMIAMDHGDNDGWLHSGDRASLRHGAGGDVSSSSALYKVVVGTLQLESGVVYDGQGTSSCRTVEEGCIGAAEGLVSMDATFPSSVALALPMRNPPDPLRVQLYMRDIDHHNTATVGGDGEGDGVLTPGDIFLGETVVHVAALTPCTSPLPEPTALRTTLLRPRRDPRHRAGDIARANHFPTGLGTLSLRVGVYDAHVYAARQRDVARRSGWRAQLMVAVQEATDFEAAGVYAVEVRCVEGGVSRRSRVVRDRNPRFHETFEFTLFGATERVEVRLLEWSSRAAAGVETTAPHVVASNTFVVTVSNAGGGATPLVHTAWLTLQPCADSLALPPASAEEGLWVSRAGMAPKLLVRWRARVCVDAAAAAARDSVLHMSDAKRRRGGGKSGGDGEDVRVTSDTPPSANSSSSLDAPLAGCTAPRPLTRHTLLSHVASDATQPDTPHQHQQDHPQEEEQPLLLLNVLWLTGELISFLGSASSTAREVISFCAARSRRIAQLDGRSTHGEERVEETRGLCLLPLEGISGREAALHNTSLPSSVVGLPLDVPLLRYVRNGDYVQVSERPLERHEAALRKPHRPPTTDEGVNGGGGGVSKQRSCVVTAMQRAAEAPHAALPGPRGDSALNTSWRAGGDVLVVAQLPPSTPHLSRSWAAPVRQLRVLSWLTDRQALASVSAAVLQRLGQAAKEALVQVGDAENVGWVPERSRNDVTITTATTAAVGTAAASVGPPVRGLLLTFLYAAVTDAHVQSVVQWVQTHRASLSGFCRPVTASLPQSFHVRERVFGRWKVEGRQRTVPAARPSVPVIVVVEAAEMYVQGSASALYALLCFLRRCPTLACMAPRGGASTSAFDSVSSAGDAMFLLDSGSPTCGGVCVPSLLLHLPHAFAPSASDNAAITTATHRAAPPPPCTMLVTETVTGYVPVLRRGAFQLASSPWEARQVWAGMAERPGVEAGAPAAADALFYHFTEADEGLENGVGQEGVVVPGFVWMDVREGHGTC